MNSPAGGARGDGGDVEVGVQFFFNINIVIQSIFAFRGCEGHLARSQGLCIFSKMPRIATLIVELKFVFLTFTFCSLLCLFLCILSSVLDKDPLGLKVLACCNKFKCTEAFDCS